MNWSVFPAAIKPGCSRPIARLSTLPNCGYIFVMIPNDDAVAGLREALQTSPNNLPIRIALAEMLMGLGQSSPRWAIS